MDLEIDCDHLPGDGEFFPPTILIQLRKSLTLYQPPDSCLHFPYGTAGFRSKAATLTHVMHRCGILCVINSLSYSVAEGVQNSQRNHFPQPPIVGAVITASHNPVEDNGIKLVGPDGLLLSVQWEKYATFLVNAPKLSSDALEDTDKTFFQRDTDRTLDRIHSLCKHSSISLSDLCTSAPNIFLGRDTRPSSDSLANAFCDGVRAMGGSVIDLGVLTTPQLHFLVASSNHDSLVDVSVNETLYFSHFNKHLRRFMSATASCGRSLLASGNDAVLYFDGANGVGGLKAKQFSSIVKAELGTNLIIRNSGESGVVNKDCGPEYGDTIPMQRCCSVDGDADRLVYFSWTKDQTGMLVCHLVDGDKIAALFVRCLVQLLQNCLLQDTLAAKTPNHNPLYLGIIQTAYANGASTDYLLELADTLRRSATVSQGQSLILPDVACVKTGVKHLHSKAMEYDISIYFEANGHGSVHANFNKIRKWTANYCKGRDAAVECLISFLHLFNATTGDALADMLAAEAALKFLDLSFTDWLALYQDRPCAQQKVPLPRQVLDRIKTNPIHERTVIEPSFLQGEVDSIVAAAVAALPKGSARAFVRPSGTEDVCRIYAEGPTYEISREIAEKISHALDRLK